MLGIIWGQVFSDVGTLIVAGEVHIESVSESTIVEMDSTLSDMYVASDPTIDITITMEA